jgi:hypothetical protein
VNDADQRAPLYGLHAILRLHNLWRPAGPRPPNVIGEGQEYPSARVVCSFF